MFSVKSKTQKKIKLFIMHFLVFMQIFQLLLKVCCLKEDLSTPFEDNFGNKEFIWNLISKAYFCPMIKKKCFFR